MAKVKNSFGETRSTPWLGGVGVEPGQVIEVLDDDLASWLEGGWEPADARTRKMGEQLLADKKITVLAGGKPAADVKET